MYQLGKVSNQAISFREVGIEEPGALPVTNLKGLVSRSPSDIYAIEDQGGMWRKKSASRGEVNW